MRATRLICSDSVPAFTPEAPDPMPSRSTTTTRMPPCAARSAAVAPMMPAPMTTRSYARDPMFSLSPAGRGLGRGGLIGSQRRGRRDWQRVVVEVPGKRVEIDGTQRRPSRRLADLVSRPTGAQRDQPRGRVLAQAAAAGAHAATRGGFQLVQRRRAVVDGGIERGAGELLALADERPAVDRGDRAIARIGERSHREA